MPPFATRYTDEALYALAQYLYALQPPANPNHMDAQSRAGRAVFEREGCGGCHTAPLYTNNRLTPANGFEVPTNGATVPDLMPVRVGTDPNSPCFPGVERDTTKSLAQRRLVSRPVRTWRIEPDAGRLVGCRAIDRRRNAQAVTGARVWTPPHAPR